MSDSALTGARPHIDESELLCLNKDCTFYGNLVWEGYCSVCYKKYGQKSHQKKSVFDPAQIKHKVSRSVSDVSEFQSKASSFVSHKFDSFEKKKQLDLKKMKSVLKKSHANKSIAKAEKSNLRRHLSSDSLCIVDELEVYLQNFNKEIQSVIIKHITTFVEKMMRIGELQSVDMAGDRVHKFYAALNEIFLANSSFHDLKQEEIDEINLLTEKYITTRLYKLFNNIVNVAYEEKDLNIQKRIRDLMWVNSSHLECNIDEKSQEVHQSMDKIITDLIEINNKRVPFEKLQLLSSASNEVFNLLALSRNGAHASADDYLPALIFCIIRANPPLLHSNVVYISNFALPSSLQSGETGYFFTNLCGAVAFIEKMKAESLGLTKAEYDRYMSGDALLLDALDGTYTCEGLELMKKNVSNLTELENKLKAILYGYDSLTQELEEIKGNFDLEINSLLERTPLTIKPRKANIDEDDPVQTLLPPPLMPQNLSSTLKSDGYPSLGLEHNDSLNIDESLISFDFESAMDKNLSSITDVLESDVNIAAAPAEYSNKNLTEKTRKIDLLLDPLLDPLECVDEPLCRRSKSEEGLLDIELLEASGSASILSLPDLIDPFGPIDDPSPRSFLSDNASVSSCNESGNELQDALYSGFTIQGFKIPNIPCGTGNVLSSSVKQVHSFSAERDSTSKLLSSPLTPVCFNQSLAEDVQFSQQHFQNEES